MFCPKCGKQLPDGTKFCGGCGASLGAPAQNPAPANQPPVRPQQAPAAPVNQAPVRPAAPVTPAAPVSAATKASPIDEIKKAAKKVPSKYMKIGVIALAAVVVLVVLISLFAGGSKAPEYVLYLKDDQIAYNDYSKNAPYEITNKLLDDASTSNLVYSSYYLARSMYLTEDGKTLFYLDKMDTSGEGTLYYNSTSKLTKDATKIDSGVTKYYVSENGKLVTYLKGDKILQYNMKESETIAKDVYSLLRVSDDGSVIYYSVREDDETVYYSYSAKHGEEEIGSDLTDRNYSEDSTTIYYLDEDKYCAKTVGKEDETLAKDVYSVIGFYEDGTFYYLTSEMDEDATMMDYFKADEQYATWMDRLEGMSAPEYYTLNYYDGKAASVVAEGVTDYELSTYNDGLVMFYTSRDVSELGGLSLATLDDKYYNKNEEGLSKSEVIYEMIEDDMGDEVMSVCIQGTVSTLDMEELENVYVSPDGKTMYLLAEPNDDNEYVLFKASISKNTVKTPEEIDDDVMGGFFTYDINEKESANTFVYFKDYKDYNGEMFIDGESIADDVYAGYVAEDNGKLYYLQDYDGDDDCGTLVCWNGKKAEEICDDVHQLSFSDDGDILIYYEYDSKDSCASIALYNGKKFIEISDEVYSAVFAADGSILYLYDYSMSKYEGELYRFTGKKAELIDEDVSAIINLIPGGTGSHYFYY